MTEKLRPAFAVCEESFGLIYATEKAYAAYFSLSDLLRNKPNGFVSFESVPIHLFLVTTTLDQQSCR